MINKTVFIIHKQRGGKFMYDSHIYCKEYHGLKQTIIDIINGDDITTNIEKLSDHIQQLYDDGEMQATQYDDLMSYIQDMC